jgi:hypothetical protein
MHVKMHAWCFSICRCLMNPWIRKWGFERLSYLVVNCFKITAKSNLSWSKISDFDTLRLLTIMVLYTMAQKVPKLQNYSRSRCARASILPEHNLAIRFGLVVRNTDSSYYAFFNLCSKDDCALWPRMRITTAHYTAFVFKNLNMINVFYGAQSLIFFAK